MKFQKSQQGMSMLGWLVILALVAFVASTAFKIMPHYFDYMSLDKAITSVETDKVAEVRSIGQLYQHVYKAMEVNGIRDIDLKEVLKVEQVGADQFRAKLKYEKREGMIKNLDLVARFEKEYELRP